MSVNEVVTHKEITGKLVVAVILAVTKPGARVNKGASSPGAFVAF